MFIAFCLLDYVFSYRLPKTEHRLLRIVIHNCLIIFLTFIVFTQSISTIILCFFLSFNVYLLSIIQNRSLFIACLLHVVYRFCNFITACCVSFIFFRLWFIANRLSLFIHGPSSTFNRLPSIDNHLLYLSRSPFIAYLFHSLLFIFNRLFTVDYTLPN